MISGIYCIRCAVNGKVYIGSAVCLKYRTNRHFNDLRKGTHASKYLQNAFNKYKEDAFIVEHLEIYNRQDITVDFLLEREQYYLDTIRPYLQTIGFNTCKVAGSPQVPMTDARREKISRALEGRKKSPEEIERMKKWLTGRKMPDNHKENQRRIKTGLKQSEENIEKRARAYSFIDEQGNVFIGTNMKRFADEYKHSRINLVKVMNGERKTHHGLKLYKPKS